MPFAFIFKLKLKIALFSIFFSSFTFASTQSRSVLNIDAGKGYSLRGNGNFIPAHFGSLARVFEEYGAGGILTGGSSASMSVFITESLYLNPFLACTDEEKKLNPNCENDRLGFMAKSIEGYIEAMPETPHFANLADTVNLVGNVLSGFRSKITALKNFCQKDESIRSKVAETFRGLYKTYRTIVDLTQNPLIRDIPSYEFPTILKDLTIEMFTTNPRYFFVQLAKIKKSITRIQDAIGKFGKFDSQNDKDIFFRPGLVNFKYVGHQVGKLANLLAAQGLNRQGGAEIAKDYQHYIKNCGTNGRGLDWPEISERPLPEGITCGALWKKIVLAHDAYFEREKNKGLPLRIHDLPGERDPRITPIISSGIIRNPSTVKEYLKLKSDYDRGQPINADDWKPRFQDIEFGLWVKNDKVDSMNKYFRKKCAQYFHQKAMESLPFYQGNLSENDEDVVDFKVCKSVALPNITWESLLSISPAEPGLTSIQEFDKIVPAQQREGATHMLTLGGWVDMYPEETMRAAGATKTLNITRRGYDSIFSEGIGIRLGASGINFDELHLLKSLNTAEGHQAVDAKTEAETTKIMKRKEGDWTQLSNLHNPHSSFNLALGNFTGVYGTNWNEATFDKDDWRNLIRDGYRGIMYSKDQNAFPLPAASNPSMFAVAPNQNGEWPSQSITREKKGAYYIPMEGRFLSPSHPWFNRGLTAIEKNEKSLPLNPSSIFSENKYEF